ncbi:MAG: DUF11 domain-containing protein [Chloroflexaceae bacterium]|nr:DUF11 domain-containing protein [Chloroflexaceae bacterium]
MDSTATRILQPNVLPDLALTKGGPPDVEAGTELTYTLTVQNTGLVTGTQVVLTDELPNGVDFVRAVQGCAIDPIYPDPTVVCSLGALGPGATRTITLVVLVDETTSGTITNQAEVSGALPETNIGNNRATATTNVLPVGGVEADLSIGKVAARNSVRAGEQVTYTLTISNAGPATATNVVVTDTLHISTTLEAVSSSQGVCPTSGTGVVCNLGTLAVGATAIVTVTVEVNETALGNVTNTATVAGGISDPRLDNNTATATVNVLPAVQEGGLLFLPFIAN